jgi:hypothetical protein
MLCFQRGSGTNGLFRLQERPGRIGIMIDARFRPLLNWTRVPKLGMRGSDFRTGYSKTLDKLEYELAKLRAKDVLIEAGFSLDALRNDGWPRSGTSPRHPGVVLYFKNADGAMEFPCGTYHKFEANLHAIALTLENLRAIDRYGVTLGHQQYRGFLAIEAPKQMTVEDAAAFVARNGGAVSAGVIIESAEWFRTAYRGAAAKLHPDVTGSREEFDRLAEARAVLDKHHKLGTANG